MGNAILTRKGGGAAGATKIIFNNYATNNIPAGNYIALNNAQDLSARKMNLAGGSVGEYFLFAGGDIANTGLGLSTNGVDAYNTSFTRITVTALGSPKMDLFSAKVGNFVLFAGGKNSANDVYSSTIDAYNTSLTRSTPTSLATARSGAGNVSMNNWAIFGGGFNGLYRNDVEAYNSALTRTIATSLGPARANLGAALVNDMAIFAGGNFGTTNQASLDVYNNALTRSTPTTLSSARTNLAGASVPNFAIFGGDTSSTNVDAFNGTITRTTGLSTMGAYRDYIGITAQNAALFTGGMDASGFISSVIYRYNQTLSYSGIPAFNQSRAKLGGAYLNGIVMFAGGYSTSNNLSTKTNTVFVRQHLDQTIFNFTAFTIYGRTITYNYALSVNGSNQTGTITNGTTIQSNQTFNGYLEFPSEI